MAIGRYLAGVGALIWDPVEDKYLLLKRSEEKDFAPGAWECVTGRLDQGEGFEDALFREVREEIGVEIRPLFLVGTTHFYRGESVPANELVGLVYCCMVENQSISSIEVQLSPEHDEYRWLTAAQAKEVLLVSDHPTERWLLRVIERAEMTKRYLPPELKTLFQENGFDLETSR